MRTRDGVLRPIMSLKAPRRVAAQACRVALKGLRDGSVTEREAAKALQAMVAAETDGKIADAMGHGAVDKAIKKVVAHLTEAPTNWYDSR